MHKAVRHNPFECSIVLELKTTQIPQEVLVIQYSYDSCDAIRESYNTFDSPDATEKNQEKIYGILFGMYRYTPKSHKLKKGQILTGLNKACNFYFPDTYNSNLEEVYKKTLRLNVILTSTY